MDNRITVDLKDGVADVRLVRADKMNALDDAMFSALIETGERLKAEGRARHGAVGRGAGLLRRARHGQFRQDGLGRA